MAIIQLILVSFTLTRFLARRQFLPHNFFSWTQRNTFLTALSSSLRESTRRTWRMRTLARLKFGLMHSDLTGSKWEDRSQWWNKIDWSYSILSYQTQRIQRIGLVRLWFSKSYLRALLRLWWNLDSTWLDYQLTLDNRKYNWLKMFIKVNRGTTPATGFAKRSIYFFERHFLPQNRHKSGFWQHGRLQQRVCPNESNLLRLARTTSA